MKHRNHHLATPPSAADSALGPYHAVRLVKSSQLRQILPVSKTTLWRMVKDEMWPKPIKIKGQNFWLLSEVQQAIDQIAGKRGGSND